MTDHRPTGRRHAGRRGAAAAIAACAVVAAAGLAGCPGPTGGSDATEDGMGCTFVSCRDACRARGEEYGSCAGGTCHCVAIPDAARDEADDADARPDDTSTDGDGDGGADPWAIPLSARTEGEEWPFEPVFVRDLAPLAVEPKAGCEQVTFAESAGTAPAGTGSDDFDVWEEALVFSEKYYKPDGTWWSDRVSLVDVERRTEYLLEQAATDGPWICCQKPKVTSAGVVYECREHCHSGRAFTVWYDLERGTKTMLRVGDPMAVEAAVGTTTVEVRVDSDHDTGHQLWTMDVRTGEQTNLTNFEPYGVTIWDVDIWGERVVWTMYPRLGSTTLTERRGEVLLPGPAAQWSPVIWEDRVCWIDARDGTGDYYHPAGAEVYCADLAAGTERRVSAGPDDRGPHPRIAVHADWVAWNEALPPEEREDVPDGVLMAYHWPSGARRRVVGDREPWPTIPADAAFPHISGDYVYFAARDGNRITNVFRCDLRVLFADATPAPPP